MEPLLQKRETLAFHGLWLMRPVFENQGLWLAGAASVWGHLGIGGHLCKCEQKVMGYLLLSVG